MATSTNSASPNLAQLVTVTRYSLLNYVRARRFLVMVFLVVAVNGVLTAAVAYTRSQAFLNSPLGFYGAWWGSFIGLFGLLNVVFFGGDAIAGEFQNKTGYYLVPNPIKRSTIYFGKYLAAFIASTLIVLIFLAFTLVNGLYYGMGVPSQFVESFFFAWLYLLAALGVTFMFSSLFKTTSIAILITILLFLFIFNVIDELATVLLNIEPWFSVTYAGDIVTSILNNPYPPHYTPATPGARFSVPTYTATVPEGLAILIVYVVVCSLIGLFLFQRKEFN